MYKQIKVTAIFVSFLMLAALGTATFGQGRRPDRNLHAGAVYVMTNQVENAVAVFRRSPTGMLTSAGEFPTGGAGDPVPQGTDPATDPLASQGALILGNNQFLFAVNAGSNQISVLRIGRNELTMVDLVDSGGIRPISLALHEDLLYVLNEGGTPNITGFTVGDDGTLTPLADSTQPLIGGTAADPAEVSFNADGTLLVVTEKAGNRINTYMIDENGLPSAPIDNPSNGMTPFGFAFNDSGTLVVSEAFGGAPNPSYGIGEDGTLTLANAVAGDTGPGSAPIDMAVNNSSRFLYVIVAGTQSVASFRVERDGSLTLIDTDGGLPLGAQGIAAK